MSETVKLKANDGHEFDAYVARPEGKPRAGLVVVQEAFGVNHHIRSVADRYAQDGFLAVAPALFDRYERGVQLGYDGADMQKAMSFLPKLNMNWAVRHRCCAWLHTHADRSKVRCDRLLLRRYGGVACRHKTATGCGGMLLWRSHSRFFRRTTRMPRDASLRHTRPAYSQRSCGQITSGTPRGPYLPVRRRPRLQLRRAR